MRPHTLAPCAHLSTYDSQFTLKISFHFNSIFTNESFFSILIKWKHFPEAIFYQQKKSTDFLELKEGWRIIMSENWEWNDQQNSNQKRTCGVLLKLQPKTLNSIQNTHKRNELRVYQEETSRIELELKLKLKLVKGEAKHLFGMQFCEFSFCFVLLVAAVSQVASVKLIRWAIINTIRSNWRCYSFSFKNKNKNL